MGREEGDSFGGSGASPVDDFDWGDPVVDTAAATGATPATKPIADLVLAPVSPPTSAAGRPAPAFEPVLEWTPTPLPTRPEAPAAPGIGQASSQPTEPTEPKSLDFIAHRIRERYFRARFPEIEPPSPSNPDPTPIIKSARLYFEDGDVERAGELLQQASEMLPREDRLLLAKLEIHFLSRDPSRFSATARLFEQRFPGSPDLPKVRRFAERLQAEARVAAGAESADERYGAWPEIANWIEAPWDLTSEVLAVELRSRLLAMPASADPASTL